MELIEFDAINLDDGSPQKLYLSRECILGIQTIPQRVINELMLAHADINSKIRNLKLSILVGTGSFSNIYGITNTEKEIRDSGLFEFIELKKKRVPKVKKERLDG